MDSCRWVVSKGKFSRLTYQRQWRPILWQCWDWFSQLPRTQWFTIMTRLLHSLYQDLFTFMPRYVLLSIKHLMLLMVNRREGLRRVLLLVNCLIMDVTQSLQYLWLYQRAKAFKLGQRSIASTYSGFYMRPSTSLSIVNTIVTSYKHI